MNLKTYFFLFVLGTQILFSDAEASGLQCSASGTRIIYVNNFSATVAQAKKQLQLISDRYAVQGKASQIDLLSSVKFDRIVLPSFGASYDEFAAKELKIKATGIQEPFLFSMIAKSRGTAVSLAKAGEVIPAVVEKANSAFDILDKLFSSNVTVSNVLGSIATFLLYDEDSVAEELKSLIDDNLISKVLPRIANNEKNIYIAHGAGGYFVDAMVKELGNVSSTDDLKTKFNRYNGIVYLGHETNGQYFQGKNEVINFDSDIAVNNLKQFPTSNYVNANHDLNQWDDFSFLYLGTQTASHRDSTTEINRSVAEVLDEKIFNVAQGLEDNCLTNPKVTICNLGYSPDDMTFNIDTLQPFHLKNVYSYNNFGVVTGATCECKNLDLEQGKEYAVHIDAIENVPSGFIQTPILPYDGFISLEADSPGAVYLVKNTDYAPGTQQTFEIFKSAYRPNSCIYK